MHLIQRLSNDSEMNYDSHRVCSRKLQRPEDDSMSTPSGAPISAAGETFKASRWTRGNLIFPTRIVVSPLHVSRVKPRMFGTTDESIAIPQVASVQIRTGIIWSEIRIDSTGGADPITSHGHRKQDAIRIRELIETYQAARTPAGN
jgi:hypothetical protein